MILCSAFLRGELWCCHVSYSPRELWTKEIKKDLATVGTQLDSRIYKAHSCITKAPANVQAATVRPYSAASAQLTTLVHGYSGDTT
jgi:hypothetical protein